MCSLFFLVERKGIRIRAVYGAQTWCYRFSVNKYSYSNYLASWIFKYMTLPYPILSLLWVEGRLDYSSQYLSHQGRPVPSSCLGAQPLCSLWQTAQQKHSAQSCLPDISLAHVGPVVPKQIKNSFLVLILENILLRGFVGSSDPPYTSA